jgi:hypothetical protein
LVVGGDPDLAVAAADYALRIYLAAFRVGQRFELPAVHAPAVRAAATAAGEHDEIAAAAAVIRTLEGLGGEHGESDDAG